MTAAFAPGSFSEEAFCGATMGGSVRSIYELNASGLCYDERLCGPSSSCVYDSFMSAY